MDITFDPTYSISGLLASIVEEVGAKERRHHELRMKELEIIDNSDLRNQFVKQLMLNRCWPR